MNEELEIRLFKGISSTPALGLAIRGWADCEERGLGDGTLNVSASMHAFLGYAANGQELLPVGVITFEQDTVGSRVWIYQSYVVPEFRGRGVYRALWSALVKHSREELKVRSIQSATHVRNTGMRAIATRLGRFEESVVLRFNLTPPD